MGNKTAETTEKEGKSANAAKAFLSKLCCCEERRTLCNISTELPLV